MRCAGILITLLVLNTIDAGEPAADEVVLARWIGKLGSDSWQEREQAGRTLDQLGAASLPKLRLALRDDDPEVRRRAAALISVIEVREYTKTLLQPKRIKLNYKNVRIQEAIADFVLKTGGSVDMTGDLSKTAGRTVTIETEELSYWEALAKLAEACGLHEQTSPPSMSKLSSSTYSGRLRGGRRVVYLDGDGVIQTDGPVYLLDGKNEALPTFVHGALRVRALPPLEVSDNADGTVPLRLELRPEPHVSWEAVDIVRITRAIDDQGQDLKPLVPYVGNAEQGRNGSEDLVVVTGNTLRIPVNCGQRMVQLQLQTGNRPSKLLREVHGTVSAYVKAAAEPVLTIEDVLKSEDKIYRAADGSRVRVRKIDASPDGLYEISIEVIPPLVYAMRDAGLRVVLMPRGEISREITIADSDRTNPFGLLDAKGRPYTLALGSMKKDASEPRRLFTLLYKPEKETVRQSS